MYARMYGGGPTLSTVHFDITNEPYNVNDVNDA